MLRNRLAMAGGAVAYVAGVAVTYEYTREVPPLPTCSERCCTFSKLAPKYDEEIARDESSSGILELRKEMARQARGKVLEVAAGTGRNLDFYEATSISDLTLGDNSEGMLQVAALKVAKHRHARQQKQEPSLQSVTLAVLDTCNLQLPDANFDTVVDTFGLCSFEEPETALREMARVCKPGGSILLLEHGASDWSLLAAWQRHRLNRHVVKWGCYWNRDILTLVRESGLRVKDVQRRHMGTTYLIRCERAGA